LKVIEAYEKHWKPEDEEASKAFDGMDQHTMHGILKRNTSKSFSNLNLRTLN
jgi:hypothetical protein